MSDLPRILFVDDEERIVRSLLMMFKGSFQVHSTTDPDEALALLKQQHFHVLVSDQRMPQMLGVDLLRRARELSPNTMRLLLTGYSDLAAIVGSINEGEIFRYINKPWDAAELRNTLQRAAEIGQQLEIAARQTVTTPVLPATDLKILVIDDSVDVFNEVKKHLGQRFDVRWGETLEDAFSKLSEDVYALVLTDVKLKGVDITAAIKSLKQVSPSTLTLVLSVFQDSRLLIDLINQGQVFRYLPKPIRPHMLQISVEAAAGHYQRLRSSPILLRQHEVVDTSKSAAATIPARVMGFLRRIRERFGTETSA
jgi:DNA-binding NtrC family response regulator